MKELFLVRHAKSSWKDASLEDIQRPLSDRGKRDAPLMSGLLLKLNLVPDLIYTSPALRAFSTAKIFAAEFNMPKKKIIIDENIYHANAPDLLQLISELPDTADRIFMIGHNPELTELCNIMSAQSTEDLRTCSILGMKFDIERWNEISGKKGTVFCEESPHRHSKKKPA